MSASAKSKRRASPQAGRGFLAFCGRWSRRAAWVVFLASIGVAGFFLFRKGERFLYTSEYFKVDSIQLQGLSAEMEQQVAAEANLDYLKGRNLFLLSTKFVENKVLRNPKIASVEVAKRYPSSLRIQARERKPAAVVNAKELYLIDKDGVLLEPVDLAAAAKADFPCISGIDLANKKLGDRIEDKRLAKTLDLFERMQEVNPALYKLVGEAQLSEDGDLTLFLNGGPKVLLGRGDPIERMPVLEAYLDSEREDASRKYVDLRVDKQMAVY